jgi:hypothetical protein
LSFNGKYTDQGDAINHVGPSVVLHGQPDPEISYDDALSVRDDLYLPRKIDYPNQIN